MREAIEDVEYFFLKIIINVMARRTARIPMTTSNSISVKPFLFIIDFKDE